MRSHMIINLLINLRPLNFPQISKRKRRRFIVKAPPPPKRRDENKGNLILNDHKQTSVAKHQGHPTIPSHMMLLPLFVSKLL